VCDIQFDQTCALIGTTFREMPLQPSILKELSEELNLHPQPVCSNYTSEDDVLYLEDMVQRVILCGDIDSDKLPTGRLKFMRIRGRKAKCYCQTLC